MNTPDLSAGTSLRSRARTITETVLVAFAAITGDWHPQHVDAEWAAESRFGERIAHGMLVLSYSIGLMGFDPDRVVALRGIDSLTFKRPVAIGETIRVEADVEDIHPIDPEHELVELRWRVLGGDDRLALRARITIVHSVGVASGTSQDARPLRRFGRSSRTVRNGEAPDTELYGERVLL
jgi:acyl dehydratase